MSNKTKRIVGKVRAAQFKKYMADAVMAMKGGEQDQAVDSLRSALAVAPGSETKHHVDMAIGELKNGSPVAAARLMELAMSGTLEPFKFKHERLIENSPFTNGERASRASHAIAVYDDTPYSKNNTADVDYDMATDLLSDIAHLCDSEGWDFDAMLNTVRMHWQAER